MAEQIFSREQYDALKQSQRRLGQALELIEKLEACDEDCAGYRGVYELMQRKLAAYEANFMGMPPP